MVTGSAIGGAGYRGCIFRHFTKSSCMCAAGCGVPSGSMVGTALRPISHLTAWVVWHAIRVSLLEDLERPQPPESA
jgi:hypothetical protein